MGGLGLTGNEVVNVIDEDDGDDEVYTVWIKPARKLLPILCQCRHLIY